MVRHADVTARRFDDDLVVFSEATGNTHQLDALASSIMQALLDHPEGLPVESLDRFAPCSNPPRPEAIEHALAELERLRLLTIVQR